MAEKVFSRIEVFEQRLNVGGVWNATPTLRDDKRFAAPSTRPPTVVAGPQLRKDDGRTQFLSPMYDDLDTNIPHTLMNYSGCPFPPGTPLFPRHESVQAYLEEYAKDIRYLIHFGRQVIVIQADFVDGQDKWLVKTKGLQSDNVQEQFFDAVIVANGHYDDPFIPAIPGIKDFNAAYPGVITHSKFYRRPEEYKDKKVLIIGNSASGTDLANYIAPYARSPLLHSVRSEQWFPLSSDGILTLPSIASFDPFTRSVTFTNGHTEYDIDSVIFCTGYLYSFPFLQSLDPPLDRTHGVQVPHLYQHLFYKPKPTLSFLCLPYRIVPFPLSEAQAAVVARHLSGRLELPDFNNLSPNEDEPTMMQQQLEFAKPNGDLDPSQDDTPRPTNPHILGYPADAEYINSLHDWALSATPRSGLDNDGRGKLPPYWDEETCWVREMTPRIKAVARALGPEDRKSVRTLGELGFVWPGPLEGNGE